MIFTGSVVVADRGDWQPQRNERGIGRTTLTGFRIDGDQFMRMDILD